jgi:hypothetical protein
MRANVLVRRRMQDWDAYMSSMLGLSATNATDPGPQMEGHYNRE